MDEKIEFLSVNSFADRMMCSKEEIYIWIKQGKIAAMRLGSGPKSPWRIPMSELYRFREMAYQRSNLDAEK